MVKKTDCDTKVTEIENKRNNHNHVKHITTPEFNTLAADVFNARLSWPHLVRKIGFDAKLASFNRKITENKTKHVLVEYELKKLKTFYVSYFIGKSNFEEDGTQNYLVFQPIIRYFKVNTIITVKELSAETIKAPTTSDNSFTPAVSYNYGMIDVMIY